VLRHTLSALRVRCPDGRLPSTARGNYVIPGTETPSSLCVCSCSAIFLENLTVSVTAKVTPIFYPKLKLIFSTVFRNWSSLSCFTVTIYVCRFCELWIRANLDDMIFWGYHTAVFMSAPRPISSPSVDISPRRSRGLMSIYIGADIKTASLSYDWTRLNRQQKLCGICWKLESNFVKW